MTVPLILFSVILQFPEDPCIYYPHGSWTTRWITWNGPEAERLRAEAHEEMTHAERIIARMLALGVAPGASQLRPVGLGTNLSDMLRHDQAFEMELVGLYEDAVRHCSRAGLSEDRLLFQALLEEEQAHARELAAWIGQLESGMNQRRDPGAAF